jgi:hypothetical protein
LRSKTSHLLFRQHVRRKVCFFSYFFLEELLHATMWLKLPKDWRIRCYRRIFFPQRILGFHFFWFCIFRLWFNMMSPSMCLHWLECEILYFLREILQVPQCWNFESRPLSTKKILAHSYLQISNWDFNYVCPTWFRS